jgi:hypothetical protein
MTQSLTSVFVKEQVPGFIRDEYSTFITFLEKYYEWMESQGNALFEIDTISNSKDVDLTTDFYLDQIKQELAPYFPEDILLQKSKFIKFLNQFYAAKGTPNSVKFLFKILYNENIDIYYPKEEILIASDGKWVLPLALRIDTDDENIFNLVGSKITGQTSKSTAIVEKVQRSIDRQLGIEYVELYISNIVKLFETGEIVSGYFIDGSGNSVLSSGRLIGSLSEIKIDPNFRGLFYNAYDTTTGYEGDPVTIVGGLNPTSGTPIGASATVGEVTKGSVIQVEIINGGFGFRDPTTDLNSSLIDFVGGFENSILGQESRASISLVDKETSRTVNVSNVSIETLGYALTLDQAANTANIENCRIDFVSTNQSLNVHPIAYVTTDGSGGGYKSLPTSNFYSLYLEDYDDLLVINSCVAVKDTKVLSDFSQDLTVSFSQGDLVRLFLLNRFEEIRKVASVTTNTITLEGDLFENDIAGLQVYKVLKRPLNDVGALGRIEIIDGGDGYAVGEYLIFTGGTGYGANAEITEVHVANNGIKSIQFNDNGSLIKGGEGYTQDNLPVITVDTASGANASLIVTEILGDGVDARLYVSRIGSITKLRISSYGYDYVEAPSISLRNADLVVSNVTEGQLFVSNTRIYQGTSNTLTTFSALVDSYENSTGLLRIFNYNGQLNTSIQIISDDGVVSANVNSVTFYGDGKAKATAKFEEGLIRYPGIYLNTDGQLSADKRLQDGRKYHNFSYLINTRNDYSKFKKTLNEVAHPLGTKTFVNTIIENTEDLTDPTINTIFLSRTTLANTFNITTGSNTMIATGDYSDLSTSVNVGDLVILTSLTKEISGTVNVTSSSNTIVGTDTNFINDLYDNASIYIATGNTDIVSYVVDEETLYLANTLGVTANDQTMNIIFDDVKTVTFVNANTIMVTGTFTTNADFVTTILQKSE